MIVKDYLHGDWDEYADWEMKDDGNGRDVPRWDSEVHRVLHYRLSEVEVIGEVSDDGVYKILYFKYGSTKYTPEQ